MKNRTRWNGQGDLRPEARTAREERPVLITGGAGFIGTNLADRLLSQGRRVLVYDNLSRPGVERNWRWLRQTHGSAVELEKGDIGDREALRQVVREAGQVYHFAAQVAVTTSLSDPVHDFEVNALGTLNLLEALREMEEAPPLLFTSTNKVYGDLGDLKLRLRGNCYEPEDAEIRTHGLNEERPLKFHSPYGCSKGAAGQYVLEYARTFGLCATVFHMSCIYGPHQFGNEDQGWVAHFLIRALEERAIRIYGDGKQVRDILFVEDLVEALMLAGENSEKLAGESFNMGGGPGNAVSLLEIIQLIGELQRKLPEIQFDDWRSADQQYYVSDLRKFSQATGWKPRTGVRKGLQQLYDWLLDSWDSVSGPVSEEDWNGNGEGGSELHPDEVWSQGVRRVAKEMQ
jgi:CDP-paratose 2-epimerase